MIGKTVLTYSDVFETLPGIVIGYRANGLPIYNIAGGSEDVVVGMDAGDDDDSDTDSAVTNDATPDAADWVPPTREAFEKLQADKARADSEAAARKRFLRDRGFDPKTGEPIEKPSVKLDDEDDSTTSADQADKDKASTFDRDKFEKAAQRTLEREIAKAESATRRASLELISVVPAALDEAGFNAKHLSRAMKFLELDTLEIDSDGVDRAELDARIASLKEDLPEFFKRTRMKDAAKDVADATTVGGGKKTAPVSDENLSWEERMKARLLGGQ